MAKKKKKETVIYCGPNLPGSRLSQYTIYKNGVPEYLGGLIEECPDLKHLFVPITYLAKTQREVKTSGAFLNQKFRAVVKHFM